MQMVVPPNTVAL